MPTCGAGFLVDEQVYSAVQGLDESAKVLRSQHGLLLGDRWRKRESPAGFAERGPCPGSERELARHLWKFAP
ncbi:hypothetical protein [Streptomyces sp. NPDC093707]|uniref:hypothetical protein n=1 Tax=Streptomyces sp. NPDC093707 TaxID=3154984 RepID=UPI00344E2DE5